MPSAEEIILAEKEAFDKLKASLLEEHRDEYVLFKDGEVADVHIGAMSAGKLRSWVDKTLGPKTSLWSRLFGGDQAGASA